MANKIHLEIITPEKLALREEVDEVVLPGLTGELGVLPDHEPLITQLKTGILTYRQGGSQQRLHVSGGFAEVLGDKVSVLSDVAEKPAEIDIDRAKAALDRAEKRLVGSGETIDVERAELKKERAKVRLQITN